MHFGEYFALFMAHRSSSILFVFIWSSMCACSCTNCFCTLSCSLVKIYLGCCWLCQWRFITEFSAYSQARSSLCIFLPQHLSHVEHSRLIKLSETNMPQHKEQKKKKRIQSINMNTFISSQIACVYRFVYVTQSFWLCFLLCSFTLRLITCTGRKLKFSPISNSIICQNCFCHFVLGYDSWYCTFWYDKKKNNWELQYLQRLTADTPGIKRWKITRSIDRIIQWKTQCNYKWTVRNLKRTVDVYNCNHNFTCML